MEKHFDLLKSCKWYTSTWLKRIIHFGGNQNFKRAGFDEAKTDLNAARLERDKNYNLEKLQRGEGDSREYKYQFDFFAVQLIIEH